MVPQARHLDRPALNRKVWALAAERGLSGDELRDVALKITGVKKKATGGGTISGLNEQQLKKVIDSLVLRSGGSGAKKSKRYSVDPPKERRADWLASPAQVKKIHHLHSVLQEAGVLTNPLGFMRKVTFRSSVEHLPATGGAKSVTAQGYIEVLKAKARDAGLVLEE